MRWRIYLVMALLIAPIATFSTAQGVEGELRVFLILTQHSGPNMLNKIVGDIGSSAPVVEIWGRKQTLIQKLAPDSYTVDVKNVEACHFKNCVPCPEKSRTITIHANQRHDATFRWKAKYNRTEKKWVCY